MCPLSTLEPAKDLGGCAFLDLLIPARRAGIGVVPATVVRRFDDDEGVIVGKHGEDIVGRDGVERVIR